MNPEVTFIGGVVNLTQYRIQGTPYSGKEYFVPHVDNIRITADTSPNNIIEIKKDVYELSLVKTFGGNDAWVAIYQRTEGP